MKNIGSLLYKKDIPINDYINIVIPTVGDIVDNEDNYYGLVFSLTASPIDMMVQLDEIGIDFSEINDYDLFLLLFPGIREQDTSLIFRDLDLSKFELAISEENGNVVLIDRENDIKIDRAIYERIAGVLRSIHHLTKNNRKPANEEAKRYLLEKAKEKAKRRRGRRNSSELEPLIIAMVNTEQYKYDFEGTRELSIYQFNKSVQQIIKKIDFDNKMYGIYSGSISVKDLKQDDLNWISHK